MERKTYALALTYDGRGFAGWQRQPRRVTVQGAVEDAVGALLGERVSVHGAARTDAGVHAERQVASFRVRRSVEPAALVALALPEGARILEAAAAAPSFHARASAVAKRYRYRFTWGEPTGDAWFLGPEARPRWDLARASLESLRGLPHLAGLASPAKARSPAPPLESCSLDEDERLAEPASLGALARSLRPWRG